MSHSRRRYLTTAGAVVVGGVAGCLSSPAAETSHNCELSQRDAVTDLPHPSIGAADASHTVSIFEDFACPHCRDFSLNVLSELRADYDSDAVQFVHYDFPIPVSDWSRRVANAARSVQAAADAETFFQFSKRAYENQPDYSWEVLGDIAAEVEQDPCRILSDATYRPYTSVIDADRDTGSDRGVEGTPAVFVDGQRVSPSYSAITSILDG